MVAPTIGAILNDRSNFKLFYPRQALNPYSKYISILKKCTCAVDTVIVVQSLLLPAYLFLFFNRMSCYTCLCPYIAVKKTIDACQWLGIKLDLTKCACLQCAKCLLATCKWLTRADRSNLVMVWSSCRPYLKSRAHKLLGGGSGGMPPQEIFENQMPKQAIFGTFSLLP